LEAFLFFVQLGLIEIFLDKRLKASEWQLVDQNIVKELLEVQLLRKLKRKLTVIILRPLLDYLILFFLNFLVIFVQESFK
jgi:hypothetical protein